MDHLSKDFSEVECARVKEIEKTTKHDVKAVEYYLKERFEEHRPELAELKEHLHFGCTSEDINNLAYSLILKNSLSNVIVP